MVTEEVIEDLVCHTAIAVHTVQAMDKEMHGVVHMYRLFGSFSG